MKIRGAGGVTLEPICLFISSTEFVVVVVIVVCLFRFLQHNIL